MESYYDDESFFNYLMAAAYPVWKEFYPHISELNDSRTVYLHSPYLYVPHEYLTKPTFFNEWLKINKDRRIIVNRNPLTFSPSEPYDGSEIHRVVTKYYDNGNMETADMYYTVDYKRIGRETIITWYPSGSLKRIDNSINLFTMTEKNRNGQRVWTYNSDFTVLDGINEQWYASGNRKTKYNYVDGLNVGLQESWREDGQIERMTNYNNNGEVHGLHEEWHKDSNRKLVAIYDNGRLISSRE